MRKKTSENSMILYGLASCDTCRTARRALEAAGRDVVFVDVRKDPPDAAARAQFFNAFGMAIVNKRSTTWRELSQKERDAPPDALLALYPTLMKRPVIEDGASLYLGWGEDVKSALT